MNRGSDPRGRDSILHESSQAQDRDCQNFAPPPTQSTEERSGVALTPLREILGEKIL